MHPCVWMKVASALIGRFINPFMPGILQDNCPLVDIIIYNLFESGVQPDIHPQLITEGGYSVENFSRAGDNQYSLQITNE